MPRLTFNAVEFSPNGKDGRRKSDVAIIGAPFDLASTRSSGQREGPAHIRFIDQWGADGMEMRSVVHKVNPMELLTIVDCGDVEFPTGEKIAGWEAIRQKVTQVYANVNKAVILLGGDHSISVMACQAIAAKEGPLTVFHFDAHPDYWKPDPGSDMDHGTWVRWGLDNGCIGRVVQFGVRGWGLSETDENWGRRNDVTAYHAMSADVRRSLHEELADTSDPIYLSIDLDVLDPAFAPGVIFQEPGGMTSRELLGMVHQVASSGKMVGADITELVPSRDPSGITTRLASSLVAQVLTGLSNAP